MLSKEQALIQEIFAPLARDAAGAAGLKDDAAVLSPMPGMDLVITVDTLVAGVHFLDADDPALIARKALRVNLSDLAAKGARPRAYVISTALAKAQDLDWLRRFAQGLAADQGTYGCLLHGGDTVSTPGPFTVSVTALGDVPAGRAVRRGGGRAGDLLYVSGSIGDAALGLRLLLARPMPALDEAHAEALVQRYRLPEPRVDLAPVLVAHAHASIDVSDGLAGDIGLLCWASGLSARIEADLVPLSEAARATVSADPALIETCLTGGDDYEIVAAVSAGEAKAFELAVRRAEIGRAHV